MIPMHNFPHLILKFTFKIEFSNPALGQQHKHELADNIRRKGSWVNLCSQ